jgi:hypothetical protein
MKKAEQLVEKKFTRKEAWALYHPHLRAVTDASFHLKMARKRDGLFVIEAADGRVYVSRDGLVSLVAPLDSINIPVSLSNFNLFALAFGDRNDAFSEFSCGSSPSRKEPYCDVTAKYELFYKNFSKRAEREVRWRIVDCLPARNKFFASYLGLIFSGLDFIRAINLIARFLPAFEQLYLDDKRLVYTLMAALLQVHVREGEINARAKAKELSLLKLNQFASENPKAIITELKRIFIRDGITEQGWRKYLSLDGVQRKLFATQFLFDGSTAKFINLLATHKIKARFYRFSDFPVVSCQNFDIAAIFLKFIESEQAKHKKYSQEFTARLSDANSGIFDFAASEQGRLLKPPKGAGMVWLRKQSDAWHAEIAQREMTEKNEDWYDRVKEEFGLGVIHLEHHGMHATMLTSGLAFYEESKKMQHCVSSRWKYARAGKCFMFHLTDTRTGDVATLDIREKLVKDAEATVKFIDYENRSIKNQKTSSALLAFGKWVALRLTESIGLKVVA